MMPNLQSSRGLVYWSRSSFRPAPLIILKCIKIPILYYNTIHLCCQTKINYKGLKTNLIHITKEESIEVRKRFPKTHIAMTCKQKKASRHTYYMEENRAAMGWLKKYRMKGMNKSIGRV